MKKRTGNKGRGNRAFRYTLISVGIVAGLAIAFLTFQWWLGEKIRSGIDGREFAYGGGTAGVEVEKVRVNLLRRSAVLSRMTIRVAADSAYDIRISVEKTVVRGISRKMAEGNAVAIPSIELRNPVATADIYKKRTPWKDKGAEAGMGKEVKIGDLSISGGSAHILTHSDSLASHTLIEDMSVELVNISTAAPMAMLRDGKLSVGRVVASNPDSTSVSLFEGIAFDGGSGTFGIDSIRIEPQLDKEKFARANYRHSDWNRLNAGKVRAYGIDTALLVRGIVSMDSVALGAAVLASHKDRNVRQYPSRKKMFHETLQALPFEVRVGKASLGPVDVTYSEVAPGSVSPGEVAFEGLTGEFTGLRNRRGGDGAYFTLDVHGKLYGRGKLDVKLYIPADSTVNRFEVTGTLSDMPLSLLNRMVAPLEHAQINSGHLDRIDFHIAGSRTHSSVEGTMRYHGLKIALLKNHGQGQRKVVTWVANELIRSDNPSDGKLRHGKGSAERHLDRSQFNYLWRSLLPLAKSTTGL